MVSPAVKKHVHRALFLLAVPVLSFCLCGQTAAAGPNGIDEELVRQAMRQEAFRLLALKAAGERDGASAGFDYHIEQAHDNIQGRLPAGPLSASELEAWLRPLLQNPDAEGKDLKFQVLINHFVFGMSLEIVNTLQFECEQVEDLIAQVNKLQAEISNNPLPDREALERAVRRLELDRRLPAMVRGVERRWSVPDDGAGSFRVFNAWKKNITGRSADSDLRLVFDLGDRYRDRYPFLDGFMENYRRLAEAFRLAAGRLNAALSAQNPSGP